MNDTMTKHGVTYQQFVHGLVKPGSELLIEASFPKMNLNHMIFGICGECAELMELIMSDGDDTHLENWIEEFGDYEFYLCELIYALGIHELDEVNLMPESTKDYLIYLSIQSGQLLDCVKKHTMYNKPLDLNIAQFHLANIRTLLDRLYLNMGLNRSEIIEANVEKLSKRYESLTYSNAAASERKDKNG